MTFDAANCSVATEHEQMLAIMPTIRPQIGAGDKRFIVSSFAFISGTGIDKLLVPQSGKKDSPVNGTTATDFRLMSDL
jgi:hypothetical protein